MSMGNDTSWVGKKPIRRIGGMSDALSIAADLGFSVASPPSQEQLEKLSTTSGEKGDDLIRVLRELTAVQRKIADLQVELQGRKDDKNVAHLTHVSEMEKKIDTLSRITTILKDVIHNKDRIIARLQQPYSLDCIPVEAEYQKQFSELLMKAAGDYGALTASAADFQWSQNFKESPSVWGEMLRPIPVALASCTRFFEAMSAMRESRGRLFVERILRRGERERQRERGFDRRRTTPFLFLSGRETMGAGGRMSPPYSPGKVESHVLKRAPDSKPPFTLGQLKKAIPPHCFRRSVLRSFSYVVYDLIIASLFYYVATNYFHLLPHPLCYVAWPIYWAVQGCVLTGVWVLAHECGHHAFSDYQWLDDIVGLILHSCLLVPYFSWKHSHRRHHSNTGSLERDEVFVPKQKSSISWFSKYLNNPPGRFLTITITLTLGWPLYLACNVSGRPYDRFACHYDPYGPIFNDRERAEIYISDAGVLAVTYGLYRLAVAKGLAWVLCVYGGPLLVVNAFLVLITYLQHTHVALPHYDSSEWDWLRGALATVDRDYGILNKVFHNITDTHVAHHLFSTMPHYHAMEATKAIKPILGEYYQFDGTPFYKAMWREGKECIYVQQDEGKPKSKGVYWYSNKFD